MMQNIAIFGGAFNPITNGHIRSAEFVLDNLEDIDEVWLSPAFRHTYGKEMASSEHRVEMCKIAIELNPRIYIFPYQIYHQLSGSTYEFFLKLKDDTRFSNYNFRFVIGMDNALSIDKWVNPDKLKNEVPFIVIPRPGYDLKSPDMWFMKDPHLYLDIPHSIPEVSSTEVRNLLIAGKAEEASKKVPLGVVEYILDNNLYL
ncbi:MAG TPA: nicotinate (nicotinamide) nucleotide adenylyltransferase [Candidatus Paceibacterota bacterium]|nr:nicotinate (nicotinamide) nucleotide adenylyltransferase [Candidatus Paceibacterota bacterium]